MTKRKKFLLIIFIIFVVNDICTYVRDLVLFNQDIADITFFETILSSGEKIYNLSLIFLGVVSLLCFINYFFKNDENY